MSGISQWLAAQGLERFAPAFEEAEIDLASLELLTDEDLRELGIPLGPRRTILAMRDSPSRPDSDGVPVGERRQITVMFVDLVGSTNMSTRIDPEIMRELLAHYKAAVAKEVVEAGGTVAKYLGDGVLAYFGWPTAREDAAECAIRCAFHIRDRVKAVRDPSGNPLQCRTGIATGLAVVGGTTGSGNAREDAVAGEVLNLAARLQALAEPDGVCVSSRVHDLVGQLFEFECAGEHDLKGFDKTITAWRPVREIAHANRFAAKTTVRRALVGRTDELALLANRWSCVVEGDGRAALILGEAGIGKSRLLEELHLLIGDSHHAAVSWQCSAFHQTKPLYPVIERLTRAAEISDDDDPPSRFAKLKALLGSADMPLDSALPLFAGLLSLPEEAGYSMPDFNPAQRRSATIAAIGEWIRRIAEDSPLLLTLEDAHWADATTLEVVNLLINALSGVPLMLVVTGRPEFAAPWSGRAKVMVIGLDRLNDRECEAIIREIIATNEVGTSMIKHILDHSDGNPLFVEELSAAFAQGSSEPDVVPDTLQGSLMARLDQLGDAKRTAQLCAVLGRQFARPLLAQLYDGSTAVLDTNLSLLVANDVVHPLGRTNEGRYQFKHALVRDAAYESLLLSDRRRLHERCGRQLEREFPEVAETEPELVAHHLRHAGLADDAATYLERAGDRASSSAAYVEAIANYRAALEQLAKLPNEERRERRELVILLKLGPALTIIDGAQSTGVREVYQQGEVLGRRVDDLDGRFKALWGLWYNANVGRDYAKSSDCAEQLVLLSEQSQDDVHVLEALHCRWSSAMFRGECIPSIRDAERGAILYRREEHHRLAAMFGGHDPGVCAHGVAASSQAIAGQLEEAIANSIQAIALAKELDHPHSIAHALMVSVSVAAGALDHDHMHEWASELKGVAETYNFPPLRAVAVFFLEWLEAQRRTPDLERLRSAFEAVVPIGPLTLLYVAAYSEELLKAGRGQDALAVIDHFLGTLKYSFGYYLPEIYRLRGECLASLARVDEAAGEFQRAAELATSQGAELFALRTALARVRCCSSDDEKDSAISDVHKSLDAIGPIERPEIIAARALARELTEARATGTSKRPEAQPME